MKKIMHDKRLLFEKRNCEQHLLIALSDSTPNELGICKCKIKYDMIHPTDFYESETTIDILAVRRRLKSKQAKSVTFILLDLSGNIEYQYTIYMNMKLNNQYKIK